MPAPSAPPPATGGDTLTDVIHASDTLARVFAALGDPTRLKLVAVLCAGGAFSIAQLTANTDISRQGVTKHLQVLAEAGVVRDVKLGRERLWQLEPAQVEAARQTLEVIGREWEVALGKLKGFVEGL
ncbi:transcriptional regulator [Jeongeupia sp. HS-3]|uniref:ArsR/SmtB family transcription factor n=1 Tax=Jeongeupia sp. HS-3 TaxID=1009682 RepID=UPI0018A57C0A|nr:metalloregulator ArsR/SmtB family transcription factor [Jeongeupia sp. HS-3]BCL74823.1 transcriptional regulator [Jeongeupia sp. HS-3]